MVTFVDCITISLNAQIAEFTTEHIYALDQSYNYSENEIKVTGLEESTFYRTRLKNNFLNSGCDSDENCLSEIFFRNIRSGEFKAFDPNTDKLLSVNQVDSILTQLVINVCAIHEQDEYRKVPLDSDIRWFSILQKWKVDEDNATVHNKVERITALRYEAIDSLVPLVYVAFVADYTTVDLVEKGFASLVVLASDKLSKDVFGADFQETLLSDKFQKYSCESDYCIDCEIADDKRFNFPVGPIEGYQIKQLLYYDHEKDIFNTQLISLSPFAVRRKSNEFMYYFSLYTLCKFNDW